MIYSSKYEYTLICVNGCVHSLHRWNYMLPMVKRSLAMHIAWAAEQHIYVHTTGRKL